MRSFITWSFLLFLIACDTESSVEPRYEDYFIKYYGEEGNQEGVDIKQLADGFIILGNSISADGNSNILLVKVDQLGNQQWINDFGGTANEEAAALEVDATGNFIIAATVTVAPDDRDVMILKVNSDGEKIDSAVYGSIGKDDVANDILITNDGDYILTGYTTNVDVSKPGYLSSTDLADIYSVRTTADLVQADPAAWRRVYGFPGVDRGVSVKQKNDGTFMFFGTTNKPPTTNSQQAGYNMFLFPAASDGIAVSTSELQLFGTLSNESASQLLQMTEGGFAMVGTSTNQGFNTPFMARVRSNNDFVNSGTIPVSENVVATSVVQAATGGFILLGKEIGSNTDTNIFLSRIAITGSITWSRSLGGVDLDNAVKVLELEDGAIVFVGSVTLDSQSKISLIKTTSTGELAP